MFIMSVAIILLIVLGAVEIRSLWKKRMRKELSIYSVLMLMGIWLCSAVGLKTEAPSLAKLLKIVYGPLNDMLFRPLQ